MLFNTKIKALLMPLFFGVFCRELFEVNKNPKAKSSECLKTIVRSNFPCGILLTFINTVSNPDNLEQVLNEDYACYTFVKRTFEYTDWLVSTQLYLVKTEDIEEFIEGMKGLSLDALWNPRAYMIVEVTKIRDEQIKTVFEILLRYNVYKSILLGTTKRNMHIIYSFTAFKPNYCGRKFDIISVGSCYNVSNLNCFQRVPLTLIDCPLRIAVSQNSPYFFFAPNKYVFNNEILYGMDQFVIETISKKEGLRIKTVFLLPKGQSLGVAFKNHTVTGLLKYIKKNYADVAGGGIVLIQNRLQMFDAIWGFNYVAFNLYVPILAEAIWKDIYKEFDSDTWILIFFAYCFVLLICLITQIKTSKKISYVDLSWLPFSLLGYFFLNTSRRLAQNSKQRFILKFWIWFTFFICNFYTTVLYSLISTYRKSNMVINENNLHLLPFEPCISVGTRQFLFFAYNQTLPPGWGNPMCIKALDTLTYVASTSNAYVVEMDYFYKLKEHTVLDNAGNPKLDKWDFTPSYALAFYFVRGYPLLDRFQYGALRIYETGLMKNHISKIYWNSTRPKSNKKVKKLLLRDLSIHFVVLSLGIFIAIGCLIIELFWSRYSKTRSATPSNKT